MKKYLNNRANPENLDLKRFFQKFTEADKKKNVLKIIPYYASTPYIYIYIYNSLFVLCV